MNQIKENNSENSNSEEEKDTGNRIKDILVLIGEDLYKFPQRDADSLDTPKIIKNTLNTFVHAIKKHGQS